MANRRLNVTGRERAPRGFWSSEPTVAVIREFADGRITMDQAITKLGGPKAALPVDIKWRAELLKKTGSVKKGTPPELERVPIGQGGVERVTIGQGGRLVIPAQYREALRLKKGDVVILRIEEGELRLTTPELALRRAQALVRQFIPANRSLADELIAERRREARRE